MSNPAPADPLLLEDLMVLLLRPDSGTFIGEGTMFYTLGGAVLIDLALEDRIEVDEAGLLGSRTVRAVGGLPPSDPLLAPAWEDVARKPRSASTFVATLGTELRGKVLDRLEGRGWIRRERRRWLGLIPSTKIVPQDLDHRSRLVGEIRDVLVGGEEPTERTAALIGLLSGCNALPEMHREIPWTSATATRSRELQEGNWGTQAAGAAVMRTTAAIAATAAVSVVVTSHASQG